VKPVAVITDFGESDYYAGALRGILTRERAFYVEITHNISPLDVYEASFVLYWISDYFEPGTVFLCAVDPEPSSEPIIVSTKSFFVVCPNNGVSTFLLEKDELESVYAIDFKTPYLGNMRTITLLAPVAVGLSKTLNPKLFGKQIPAEKLFKLKVPENKKISENTVETEVVHIDRFGNIILWLKPQGKPKRVCVGSKVINSFHPTFKDAEDGELFLSVHEGGNLQIILKGGNASKVLNVKRGDKVFVEF